MERTHGTINSWLELQLKLLHDTPKQNLRGISFLSRHKDHEILGGGRASYKWYALYVGMQQVPRGHPSLVCLDWSANAHGSARK